MTLNILSSSLSLSLWAVGMKYSLQGVLGSDALRDRLGYILLSPDTLSEKIKGTFFFVFGTDSLEKRSLHGAIGLSCLSLYHLFLERKKQNEFEIPKQYYFHTERDYACLKAHFMDDIEELELTRSSLNALRCWIQEKKTLIETQSIPLDKKGKRAASQEYLSFSQKFLELNALTTDFLEQIENLLPRAHSQETLCRGEKQQLDQILAQTIQWKSELSKLEAQNLSHKMGDQINWLNHLTLNSTLVDPQAGYSCPKGERLSLEGEAHIAHQIMQRYFSHLPMETVPGAVPSSPPPSLLSLNSPSLLDKSKEKDAKPLMTPREPAGYQG